MALNMDERKYSEDFDLALRFASMVHKSQFRKKTQIPYITHPVHVAMILERFGYSKDIVIAGLLHDVLEDADFSDAIVKKSILETFEYFFLFHKNHPNKNLQNEIPMFIKEMFGETVFNLVNSVTFIKSEHLDKTWKQRKELQLKKLDESDKDSARLKGADVLHNLESLCLGLISNGLESFGKFDSDDCCADVPWYYCQSAKKIKSILGNEDPLSLELIEAAKRLHDMVDNLKAS